MTTDPPQDDTEIRQLDEDTVARIAAGEVVERPASAVKELVENSLDADADSVDVTVEAGGTDLIRVADDGRGMSEADLRAAVREHTTSKIDGLEDLESGVATLGFRGEALHTIGSVSRMTIRSWPRGSEGAGTELVYEGGDVTSVEPTGCPEGTTVEIEDLFYNTPARRKFLKTTATEFSHVNRVVTRYALANPDVAVSLTHDGREVFSTTGQGDLQAAVLAVYGREVASSMIPVEADGDDLPPGPLESVSGLVSHPETNRSSRDYLATYVNGRAVTADAVREGIMGAYGTQLGGDRYPFVTLFLEVPGEAVDVNVHPRKREVRFDDDDAVRRQVDAAVESALLEHGLLRSRAPRGRSAPGEARVRPDARGTGAGTDPAAAGGEPATLEDGVETGSSASDSSPTERDEDDGPGERSSTDRAADARTETDASDPVADSSRAAGDRAASASSDSSGSTAADSVTHTEPDASGSTADSSAPDSRRNRDASAGRERGRDRDADRKFDAATEQRTLTGEAATGEETAFDSLPPLRVLGQLHDTYLVCETDDGLVLIDQHAADERVNYERLQAAFADDPTAQALADPVELELTAAEAEAFAQYSDALSRLGFYADRTDDRTVAVTTVPAVLEETLEPDRLRDVLASFVAGDSEAGAETVDALADEFLGDLACYPSITGNTSLTEGSVVDLLEALDDCENPYACPHGRPVIVRFDEAEIEDRFERDYPGHGG
ncbi:DNA mismatch repair protein MutL [Natrinema pellirubrum DSM 15624]|uniref:DNA mismatch repair protein MutL n=1 Tax=Natrinema pellirubrum (strain DSM 15624 / CIP 106293 / JCM 10476 / NCIMB 786 / 157) TaxID=797303 RepID=L0JJU2_NATP1|nr:DNA mismatch repair endonuclease MutL [Natrinema pellirubrum]AGB30631.1 DNA mismatch repair protein MutL [Natrinema pellirubrum DSM 15624]ELY74895.1 DNA mismatch repair protein MutL [Natrinema pellirubrum DSM 15624]